MGGLRQRMAHLYREVFVEMACITSHIFFFNHTCCASTRSIFSKNGGAGPRSDPVPTKNTRANAVVLRRESPSRAALCQSNTTAVFTEGSRRVRSSLCEQHPIVAPRSYNRRVYPDTALLKPPYTVGVPQQGGHAPEQYGRAL